MQAAHHTQEATMTADQIVREYEEAMFDYAGCKPLAMQELADAWGVEPAVAEQIADTARLVVRNRPCPEAAAERRHESRVS